jgi:hypothetical protein
MRHRIIFHLRSVGEDFYRKFSICDTSSIFLQNRALKKFIGPPGHKITVRTVRNFWFKISLQHTLNMIFSPFS